MKIKRWNVNTTWWNVNTERWNVSTKWPISVHISFFPKIQKILKKFSKILRFLFFPKVRNLQISGIGPDIPAHPDEATLALAAFSAK